MKVKEKNWLMVKVLLPGEGPLTQIVSLKKPWGNIGASTGFEVKKFWFILYLLKLNLLMPMLSLHCCTRAFSSYVLSGSPWASPCDSFSLQSIYFTGA